MEYILNETNTIVNKSKDPLIKLKNKNILENLPKNLNMSDILINLLRMKLHQICEI